MSKISHLNKKEKEALGEFRKEIAQKLGREILELKLFGSKARGDFSKDSDIDVLLVLKRVSGKTRDKIYDLVNDILLKHEIDLSVKIFSEKEYNDLNNIPSVFMQLLQKEAISLL